MEFFKDIKNSIYGPGYYQELLTKPFLYSLKYYVLFILLVSILVTGALSFMVLPKLKVLADNFAVKLVRYYPDELKVAIINGQVSTSVAEPYMVAMPNEFKNTKDLSINNAKPSDFKNLITFDTKSEFTVEKFTSYDTALLLTKDSYVARDKNGAITIHPISKDVNFALDKAMVISWVNKIQPFTKFMYPLGVAVIFIISMIVLFFGFLGYLGFGALVIWAFAAITKQHISYGKAYQLGMHLLTPGIIIGVVAFLAGWHIPIPFFSTILLLLLAFVNIKTPEQVSPQI